MNKDILFGEEEAPYIKKKVKKKSKRVDHKHKYQKGLIYFNKELEFFKGPWLCTYCEICGKLKDTSFPKKEKLDKNLPIFYTDQKIFDRIYLPISG